MRIRLAAAGTAIVVLAAGAGEAHKGVTSKFTYNGDVHAIFLRRCSACHIDGGVGPMSLLKYEDAFPWAEAIRAELLAADRGDPHDFIKAAHRQIGARELDIVLDWATGGTPEGDPSRTPPSAALVNDWPAGRPDVILPMPEAYAMPAQAMEGLHEIALAIAVTEPREAARVDLLPGNPAIVRSAVLSLRLPDGHVRLLGTWVPRQGREPIALAAAVRLEPGAHLVARIQYKKTWKLEGQPAIDRSSLGVYFAD